VTSNSPGDLVLNSDLNKLEKDNPFNIDPNPLIADSERYFHGQPMENSLSAGGNDRRSHYLTALNRGTFEVTCAHKITSSTFEIDAVQLEWLLIRMRFNRDKDEE
jgi:hypothetical protein